MNSNIHLHAYGMSNLEQYKQDEAGYEGFISWDGLMKYFKDHNVDFKDTFRIEFELMKE